MVQNFKNLKIYKDAFQLSKELYLALESKRMSFRTREQIWASASSICANIAEMGAFESKSQQKQKMIICIAEANETEFWLDMLYELKVLGKEEHSNFIDRIIRIRSMLYHLKETIRNELEEKI